jgi:hypothetical protein
LWLVSRREERRQVNVEIIATGVLSLAAPAAYWVGIGRYDTTGWWLWILVWLQTAASIVYAYLRLAQRDQTGGLEPAQAWKMGRRAFAFTSIRAAALYLLPLRNTMAGDALGHLPSCDQVETNTYRYPPTDRQHNMDHFIHRHMEALKEEDKAFQGLASFGLRQAWLSSSYVLDGSS